MLIAGLAESGAAVSPAEHSELITLLAEVGQPAAAITALGVGAADSPAQSESRRTLSSSSGA
jgi:hypothetical protein